VSAIYVHLKTFQPFFCSFWFSERGGDTDVPERYSHDEKQKSK